MARFANIVRNDGTNAPASALLCSEGVLTETDFNGTKTHTLSFLIPAGAWIVDLILHATAVWTASTSATGKAGDVVDDDGLFTGIDMKATDFIAAEGLALSGGTGLAGGKVGADVANSQFNRRYLSTARTVSVIVTQIDNGGTNAAGVTRALLLWATVPSGLITAATVA